MIPVPPGHAGADKDQGRRPLDDRLAFVRCSPACPFPPESTPTGKNAKYNSAATSIDEPTTRDVGGLF